LNTTWLYSILAAAIIGAGGIMVTITTSWVNGVNADRAVVHQLQWRSQYLHGKISAAPVKEVSKQ
jgi:hypothetical protein